ncbi:MAG: CPBP family intramembrane metalloprotease [Bacteroidales bacterium]|nr:CPBP family intramembrane metalloprotease [Bacteroidales bacterium]
MKEPHPMTIAIAVAVTTCAFLIYHFSSGSLAFKRRVETLLGYRNASFDQVVANRLLGFLLFGGLPLIAIFFMADFRLKDFGFGTQAGFLSWMWIAILSVAIITMNFLNAPQKSNLAMYPQIRIPVWSASTIFISAITWILYLAAYEFMFRGFLLFALYSELGMVAAIAINTSIYSLVHIPKGKTEALGAIPLGILLCYLTLITGNLLIAFVVHVVMALSNEWFSLRVHPEMKVLRK